MRCLFDLPFIAGRRYSARVLDRGGDWASFGATLLAKLLHKGLGDRARLVVARPASAATWAVTDAPASAACTVRVGILSDPSASVRNMDVGPTADDVAADAFRNFWGTKSELRRFPDGSIHEAVVWSGPAQHAHIIQRKIVSYLLARHCQIDPKQARFVINPLESLLTVDDQTADTGSSDSRLVCSSCACWNLSDHSQIIAAFDRLGELIRHLADLPLPIATLQGVHPAFRYTDVFPPRSRESSTGTGEPVDAAWTPALDAFIIFETSHAWPSNVEAINHLKTAFYIRIAKLLAAQHKIACTVMADAVDVTFQDYLFRIRIHVVCAAH